MDPNQTEHVQYIAGLCRESDAAAILLSAARSRIAREPQALAASWASQPGLQFPEEYWAVNLACQFEEGRADAGINADIEHRPGIPSGWSLRIGAIDRDVLGADRSGTSEGSPLVAYDRGRPVAGSIALLPDQRSFRASSETSRRPTRVWPSSGKRWR